MKTKPLLDVDLERDCLIVGFTIDESPLWSGAGSISEEGENLAGLDEAGRELALLLGKHRDIAAVELVNTGDQCRVSVVARDKQMRFRALSITVREVVLNYFACEFGKLVESEAYKRKVEEQATDPEKILVTPETPRFFDS